MINYSRHKKTQLLIEENRFPQMKKVGSGRKGSSEILVSSKRIFWLFLLRCIIG